MIKIKHLTGKLGDFRLTDLNLTVDKGEYRVIVGPTGAGKSVLIEFIVGIYTPEEGAIFVDGREISRLPIEERHIAYVPQDYALFPNLNVEKNLAYGLSARRVPVSKQKPIVEEMIAMLHLESIRHRMPRHLSGGEKQRVALGRALATRPRVILMDEPLSALDENLRSQMARELRSLQQQTGSTLIHISHNFEEAADVADRITIMDHGKIVQTGTLKELMEAPSSAFVAGFLKTQNIFKAKTEQNRLSLGGITWETPHATHPGQSVTVAIRPEHIAIADPKDQKPNTFSATVESARFKPLYTEVMLNVGIPLVACIPHETQALEGETLSIHIPPDKIIVIKGAPAQ